MRHYIHFFWVVCTFAVASLMKDSAIEKRNIDEIRNLEKTFRRMHEYPDTSHKFCENRPKSSCSIDPVRIVYMAKLGVKDNGSCYCDINCLKQDDCCPDFLPFCKNISRATFGIDDGRSALLENAPVAVKTLLDNVETWSFDTIALHAKTNASLLYTGMKIMLAFNVTEFLKISEKNLEHWLRAVENKYTSGNSYHNSIHGADTLQAAAFFIGKNVSENHHAAATFKLTLENDDLNIFKHISDINYKTMRKSIIDMILATNMAFNREHVERFVNATNSFKKEETLHLAHQFDSYTSTNYGQQQAGFITAMLVGGFNALNGFVAIPDVMRNLEKNLEFWRNTKNYPCCGEQ